jgi:hypothetical protein
MSKVVGLAVAVVVAAMASPLWTKSTVLVPPSEAVATSVRILPLEIVSVQLRDLLLR